MFVRRKSLVVSSTLVKGSTTGNLTVTLEWEKKGKSKVASKTGNGS